MQESEVKTAEQPDTGNRGKWVHVMCSDAERKAWKLEAAAAKLTVADLIRQRMATKLEGRAPKKTRAARRADPELIRSVGRVGSNLNQIARWCNSHAEAKDAPELLAALLSIDAHLNGVFPSYRPAVLPVPGDAE